MPKFFYIIVFVLSMYGIQALQASQDLLSNHYQILTKNGTYQKEMIINITKKDFDNEVSESVDIIQVPVILYKEWDNGNSLSYIIYKDINNEEIKIVLSTNNEENKQVIYVNGIENPQYDPDIFLLNIFYIDYLSFAYPLYSFKGVKENSEYVFIKGISTQQNILHKFIRVHFSKQYGFPIKIILSNHPSKSDITITVSDIDKVNNNYYPLSYFIENAMMSASILVTNFKFGFLIN